MSEYQLFCYSEGLGREYSNSYQQKPFRVFNVEVTEEEYKEIKIPKIKLEFDPSESYTTRFQTAFKKAWAKLSKEEKQEFFDIPHFNWEIFTNITGVEKEKKPVIELTEEQLEQIKKYYNL